MPGLRRSPHGEESSDEEVAKEDNTGNQEGLKMNPTTTLAKIRAKSPCEEGWKKLLAGLGYKNGKHNPDHIVSLGDIATTNDAADAMWCVRALDWSYIAVRRAVIAGAVLPAVKRASKHIKDQRVFDAIGIIECWCAGDDSADLNKARKAAADAAYAYAYAAADAAAYAAAYAADAYAARQDEYNKFANKLLLLITELK